MTEYKALSSIEAIRKRPEQFIGSTENPTQLAKEVIDNAIDELVNNFATLISVDIDDRNHVCRVVDDGRGIKIENVKLDNGEIKDSIEVLFTHLFSGSKFDSSVYTKLYGMHGVGLVAVNALSEYVKVYTRDRRNKNVLHYYEFRDSKLVSRQQFKNSDKNWSTIVEFKPNSQFFESLDFDLSSLGRLLLITKSRFPDSTIYFNQKKLPNIEFKKLVRLFLQLDENEQLFETRYENGDCGVEIYFTISKDPEIITLGDINCRPALGRFVDNFKNTVLSILEEKYKVAKKLLSSGIRIYISLFLPVFEIDAQIKSRTVSDVRYTDKFKFIPKKTRGVTKVEFPVIDWIEKTLRTEYIRSVIESHLDKKLRSSSQKRTKKRVSSLSLRDCRKIPGKVLYLVEGESALGPVDTLRDKQTEAVFPISGKIPNIETISLSKLQSSVKVKDLKEVIGSKGNYRYERIKLVFDADADGGHIVTLLLVFLAKFAEDLIKDGKVSIVITPLYIAKKGKQIIPVYNAEDVEKYVKKGYTIKRIKGLGEMSIDEFRTVLSSNYEYIVEYPENIDTILKIVSDTNLKISLMNSEKTKLQRLLDYVINDKNNIRR